MTKKLVFCCVFIMNYHGKNNKHNSYNKFLNLLGEYFVKIASLLRKILCFFNLLFSFEASEDPRYDVYFNGMPIAKAQN